MSFDSLIFSYIFKLNVIGVRNYPNGLWGNNNRLNLLQLRLPDLIPDKPAIHVLNHRLGSPLEIVNNCNHFGYLMPISLPTTESLVQRLPIISQESEITSSQQSSDYTSTSPTILTPPTPPTPPTISGSPIDGEVCSQPTTIFTPNEINAYSSPTLSTP